MGWMPGPLLMPYARPKADEKRTGSAAPPVNGKGAGPTPLPPLAEGINGGKTQAGQTGQDKNGIARAREPDRGSARKEPLVNLDVGPCW